MNRINVFATICVLFAAYSLKAQGPPITLDKPIMLGEKKGTVRAMFRYADNKVVDYTALMLEGDYNFSNRIAAGIELPLVYTLADSKFNLGDASAFAKYQFIQKDGMGKTVRIAAKVRNTFPTGPALETPIAGMGHNRTWVGLVGAREALRLGIQAEAGYAFLPNASEFNQFQYKLGFGLPLLKPSYPVKQINLYFEFEGINLKKQLGSAQYGYFYAQGLQYAKDKNTFDLSAQFPISQSLIAAPGMQRNLVLLAGMRRIL